MLKLRQVIFGFAAASAIALLPMAPAMAGGHGFRPLHSFGLGRGVVGAAVALATLPLVIASAVVSGVSGAESVAPYPAAGYGGGGYGGGGYGGGGYGGGGGGGGYGGAGYGYAPQVSYSAPRPYYAPYPGYYAAPRGYYGPRPYYAAHPGYYGHGYYRGGGNSYPRR
jgi:hypothetical protein